MGISWPPQAFLLPSYSRNDQLATVALTKDTFENTILENETVIVDFWAEWCGPCKMFAPTFEAVSSEHPEIVFAKVDTEDQQELASHFNIRSIPTLMIFRDQIGIYSQPGALPEPAFRDLIDQAMGLDMDEVRKEIEDDHDHDQVADHDHAH